MRNWLRRLGTLLLFLAVALCFSPSLIPPFLDRIYYEGPGSGHFDGERFFNPTPGPASAAHGGPARFMNRFIGSSERAQWPERVSVPATVPPRRVDNSEMLVTWIGHATVLVQTAGLNILTDPIWSERASPFSFAGPKRVRAPGVRFEDLPRIDLVLVSHNHYDHMDLPTLKRLWERDQPVIVTSLGNDSILRQAGIPGRNARTDCGRCPGVEALDWGSIASAQGAAMEAWRTKAVGPAPLALVQVLRNHHWSSRWGTDRNRALWSAFAIRIPGGNIFFAGDTGWGDGGWAKEAAQYGPYRLAILPVGAYEPRDVMQANHIDPDEAVRIFEILNPITGLGMHWGTFQLTFEAIDDPPRRLAAATKGRAILPGRFVTTEVGRSFRVP
ncbi:MAG TPA: MBL fold metallo-hydrolase [Allosphingosinicella sp.]|jgi:L-ascorbate metabolism protein UlaG (beta-lactamase superfamily)